MSARVYLMADGRALRRFQFARTAMTFLRKSVNQPLGPWHLVEAESADAARAIIAHESTPHPCWYEGCEEPIRYVAGHGAAPVLWTCPHHLAEAVDSGLDHEPRGVEVSNALRSLQEVGLPVGRILASGGAK